VRAWRVAGVFQVALAIAFPALAAGAPDDRYDAVIRDAIADVGGRHLAPLALVKAVIRQESGFRPRAVSRAGARGLMQVMPGTAKRVGVRPEDLFDPAQNIRAGVRFLSVLLDHYRGDIISTLVAYNARPRNLFAPIPRNGETPGYVWAVLAYYEWYSRHAPSAVAGCAMGRIGRVAAREETCRDVS
jgi:soluble lytic murein transglycosylase-like protein